MCNICRLLVETFEVVHFLRFCCMTFRHSVSNDNYFIFRCRETVKHQGTEYSDSNGGLGQYHRNASLKNNIKLEQVSPGFDFLGGPDIFMAKNMELSMIL